MIKILYARFFFSILFGDVFKKTCNFVANTLIIMKKEIMDKSIFLSETNKRGIKKLSFFMSNNLFAPIISIFSPTPYDGVCRQRGTKVGQKSM
jgi:hypothetical protein